MDGTADLDATVTESGDLLVPAAALSKVIDADGLAHVRLRAARCACVRLCAARERPGPLRSLLLLTELAVTDAGPFRSLEA